jgi:hypothetical protein
MRHQGASRIYAKKLAPNDNSKNQVYLGGDFSALNVIPHGDIYTDTRPMAGSKRARPKAAVNFCWVDTDGKHRAPHTQLILYPDYPEVRMSGFLKNCRRAPSHLMRVRDLGRILILGVTFAGEVLGYVVAADSPIAAEVNGREWETLGVFLELPSLPGQQNPRAILLAELKRIFELRWIMSQKLARDGNKMPYSARNGGGYTLEAELGITPNGYSEPDFMGWEVKQFGVNDFLRFLPRSPVTLMTPEPTGGLYQTVGIGEFMRRFGYADKSGKADRRNFGGIYTCDRDFHADTGLRMTIDGFDPTDQGKITDLDGGISLRDRDGNDAAVWSFKGMMQHWNRKHAQAAYVPSLFRTPPPEYAFGSLVLLCEQTDFILFLKAFVAGAVYYDPAIKVENVSAVRPDIKRRSQFRIKHRNITQVYHRSETVDLRVAC